MIDELRFGTSDFLPSCRLSSPTPYPLLMSSPSVVLTELVSCF